MKKTGRDWGRAESRRRVPTELRMGSSARRSTLQEPSRNEAMGLTRERPGAEGPVRIAPAERRSQGDSGILPGSIATEALDKADPAGPDEPQRGPSGV